MNEEFAERKLFNLPHKVSIYQHCFNIYVANYKERKRERYRERKIEREGER